MMPANAQEQVKLSPIRTRNRIRYIYFGALLPSFLLSSGVHSCNLMSLSELLCDNTLLSRDMDSIKSLRDAPTPLASQVPQRLPDL